MPDHMIQEERRQAAREDDLVRAVVVAVRKEVAAQIMPEELHREHHDLIAELIAEMRRKRERAEKIKAQVGGWAIITILSAIGTGVYQLFLMATDSAK
jgi:hypothetical protein